MLLFLYVKIIAPSPLVSKLGLRLSINYIFPRRRLQTRYLGEFCCIKLQEAQLSQRDRAMLRVIAYFLKSLKATQARSFEMVPLVSFGTLSYVFYSNYRALYRYTLSYCFYIVSFSR